MIKEISMKPVQPFNLIIAGVGGQGVFSLTRVFRRLCHIGGIQCQGSTFKGGAQKMGAIHSMLRMFLQPCCQYHQFSMQIPDHSLDMMIGLEPWESLRYQRYFHSGTHLITNTCVFPFFSKRGEQQVAENPVRKLRQLHMRVVAEDYSAKAVDAFGSARMVNYQAGRAAVESCILPFQLTDFIAVFMSEVKLNETSTTILGQQLADLESGLESGAVSELKRF